MNFALDFLTSSSIPGLLIQLKAPKLEKARGVGKLLPVLTKSALYLLWLIKYRPQWE